MVERGSEQWKRRVGTVNRMGVAGTYGREEEAGPLAWKAGESDLIGRTEGPCICISDLLLKSALTSSGILKGHAVRVEKSHVSTSSQGAVKIPVHTTTNAAMVTCQCVDSACPGMGRSFTLRLPFNRGANESVQSIISSVVPSFRKSNLRARCANVLCSSA